jgi:acyl-CoA reductase-like NAD-dependent aldehyde dehydrogenase
LKRFSEAVDALRVGLPWLKDVAITPLAEPEKPKYLKELIDDAQAKVRRERKRERESRVCVCANKKTGATYYDAQ